jgi:hypothetical protein
MGDAAKPVQMIDYGYDSGPVSAWVDHLMDSTLTFAGVSPQSVGRSVDGGATSGTALKLKMSHSLMEAAGKGRHYDRGLARLLRFAALLDSRPTTQGGFGRRWSAPDQEPAVARADGLLRDDVEAAETIAKLVGAEAISVEEAVRSWRPEWSASQVEEEVARIRAEHGEAEAPATISTPRPPVPLPDGGGE